VTGNADGVLEDFVVQIDELEFDEKWGTYDVVTLALDVGRPRSQKIIYIKYSLCGSLNDRFRLDPGG
jgi:hypothetical protein